MKTRVIVSALIQDNQRILLGKKAKGAPPYPDVWHLPGGGVADQVKGKVLIDDGAFNDSYFISELRREVKEETSVRVDNITNIIPKYRLQPREGHNKNKQGEETHYYFLEYLCTYTSGTPTPGDDLAELQWVEKNALQDFTVTEPSKEMYRELGWIS